MTSPIVKPFYDAPTGSWQYVFHDPETHHGAIVDPVLDFDPLAGATATRRAEEILAYVEAEGLEIIRILDTHPRADHFSAAPWLKARLGAPTAIGERVVEVQKLWKEIYNLPESFPTDGSQWDRLLADGARFMVGSDPVEVLFTPGHTLASIAYVAGDAAFVHDTLMMPDSGTSRADFPGGDAGALHDSIARLLTLPDDTRVFVGHDYAPELAQQVHDDPGPHRVERRGRLVGEDDARAVGEGAGDGHALRLAARELGRKGRLALAHLEVVQKFDGARAPQRRRRPQAPARGRHCRRRRGRAAGCGTGR
ncbi:MAG: MBL fold metallo-hydrolase [Alphaproteobacteria bacterium HGW-Alphaproteobacteria-6]|nr:MAG: MBL fold metallo-hydrolase [Alphaproteobacteria bacterium HGW-Alphaproteobacteria-6]